ncbi:MAG TPA: HlyD family efflux transporter periplasmic adaptor subunit [Steroidobacteraceae bacterium]|jgi:HlyD family secretion protein|nr:HlyD family efflux transporter periplasmic adaptor subunit [Steroidobacteraceae bacterium]
MHDSRVIDVSSRRAGGAEPGPPPAGGGMDQPIARPPAWRRYAPYAAAAVLAIGAAIWLLHGIGVSTYRVAADQLTIGTVTRGKFEDYIAVRATAAPLTTFYLTTEQGGGVKQVLAEDGAIVKAGQPLIVLSNTALRLQVASREADISGQINTIEGTKLQLEDTRFKYQSQLLDIEHQLAVLRSDLARDKILLDGNAIAPMLYAQEQEQYRYELKLRAATIVSRNQEQQLRTTQLTQLGKTLVWLKDNIATARASLDALTIRAPTAGQLTALDAKVGQSKVAGAVLGQVDSRDRFKLTAEVDEFYLGRIALGQRALFTVGERNVRATVVKIYPQVSDGTFKVDLHFDGAAPGGITVGQAIDMKLELGGAATALMLPNGPFYQDTGGQWAFVLTPGGRYATRRRIELGRRNPDHVEVLEGLEPGDRVIVSSYQGFDRVQRVELEKPNHQN